MRLRNIKLFVYAFSLLSAELYSAFSSMSGVEHNEGDAAYLYYMLLVFAISMAFLMSDLPKAFNVRFNKKLLLIPLCFTCFYWYDVSKEGQVLVWTEKAYKFHIFFSLPAILIGGCLTVQGKLFYLYKYIDLLMMFLGIGMLCNLPKMVLTGGIIEGYQNISYQAALAFGFVYYGILTNREDRFAIFRGKKFKIVSIVFCVLLTICTLASGGRGGVVFLFFLMFVISFKYVKRSNIYKTLFLYIPILLLSFSLLASVVRNSVFSRVLDVGMERAFSYITDEGIDMSQTSNRDEAYELAISEINKEPITGKGIFHTIGTTGYPHNIILEITEQGGFLYLTIWLFLFLGMYKRARVIYKNEYLFFLIPLFLYPSIMLMFSGTYLTNANFWFFFSVCYSLRHRRNQIITYN